MTPTTPRQEVLPRVWVEWNELPHITTPTCLSNEEKFKQKKIRIDHTHEYLSRSEHEQKLTELRARLKEAKDTISGRYSLHDEDDKMALFLLDQALDIAR